MKKALILSCFEWYKERLEPIRELLVGRGYDVTVLTTDFNHTQKRPREERFEACTYVHVPPYRSNLSVQRIRSHLCFARVAARYLDRLRPELVYAVVPPNRIADHCRRYRQKHPDTRLIVDIIDLWPESMPLGRLKATPPAKLWARWRDASLEAADHVFTECDLYRQKLALDPARASTLHLFKDQGDQERALVRACIDGRKAGAGDGVIRFAYLGSMNHIIDIDGICGVLKGFIEAGHTCELVAVGGGEARERFEEAVRRTGCRTRFCGFVYDALEKARLLAPCDYAFNMMTGEVSVGLTIKSIDYLSYGLPLINNIRGDTWRLVEEEGIGVNVEGGRISAPQIDHGAVADVFERRFTKASFVRRVAEIL